MFSVATLLTQTKKHQRTLQSCVVSYVETEVDELSALFCLIKELLSL